jgi:hypothetical protein
LYVALRNGSKCNQCSKTARKARIITPRTPPERRPRLHHIQRIDVDEISAKGLLALVYLVVPGSILAYTAFVWLLKNASVSTATTYAYVNPVIALFLGWAVVDEAIGAFTLASAVAIVGAVAIVLRREAHAGQERARREHGRENVARAVDVSLERRGAA